MATKNSAGGFKQMPKMETTEPSVILKLKKGGHVNTKHLEKGEHGHSSMSSNNKFRESMEVDGGDAPKKPSVADRKKAMNPTYKDGGKVEKKAMGGMMGRIAQAVKGVAQRVPQMAAQAPAQPAARPGMLGALASAVKNASRPTMGGRAGSMMGAALGPGMKKGGDVSQDKAMIKKAMKQHDSQQHKGEKGTNLKLKTGGVTMGKPGGYAAGGTISGNEGPYKNTKMHDGDKKDTAKGTGGVRMGNSGGYADGGTVDWANRPADTAKAGVTNTKTGEVRKGNAGGYKDGGNASKKAYATGGSVNDEGKAVKMPARPVSRPVANSLQSGTFAEGGEVSKKAKGGTSTWGGSTPLRLIKTHTGPKGHVAKVYKDKDWGEHRVKFYDPDGKHRAESDYHTDDLSDAHDTAKGQLNRYQDGGKAKKFEDGGSTDRYSVSNPKAVSDKASRELEDALNPLSMAKELYSKAKSYITPPAGSVTKTEKSVTVAPGKKRGGSASK